MVVEGNTARLPSPDVRTRLVVLTMAGILVALVTIAFGARLLFPDRIGATSAERHALPSPGVGPNERAERLRLEATQRAALEGAGGRITIAEAMRQIAAKGPHAFDPIDAPP
jgi:hypothetical protein